MVVFTWNSYLSLKNLCTVNSIKNKQKWWHPDALENENKWSDKQNIQKLGFLYCINILYSVNTFCARGCAFWDSMVTIIPCNNNTPFKFQSYNLFET